MNLVNMFRQMDLNGKEALGLRADSVINQLSKGLVKVQILVTQTQIHRVFGRRIKNRGKL